jgi:hypothetical protein
MMVAVMLAMHRAASGQVAAVAPTNEMKSRRRMTFSIRKIASA